MLYVVVSYVPRLSPHVKNFKKLKDYVWNFSCPICNDISKGKQLSRGYVYRKGQTLNYICHHCQESSSFMNFLKKIQPDLYKECSFDIFKARTQTNDPSIHKFEKSLTSFSNQGIEINKETKDMISVLDLKDDHPALINLRKRLIPSDMLKLFYYTDKFKAFTNSLKPDSFNEASLKIDGPRIVIPFFDNHHKMFAFAGRSMGNDKPKYLTIKLFEDQEKIYGVERIDFNKQMYVVEGPIDSLFIDNCLAVAGSGFDTPLVATYKENIVIIPDNEPRKKEIVNNIKTLIQKGYYICLFPKNTNGKDINEMIKNGYSKSCIMKMIHTNTFRGPMAMIKFIEWKMIS